MTKRKRDFEFEVVNRPSKGTTGITKVIDVTYGRNGAKDVKEHIGNIHKDRGVSEYTALTIKGLTGTVVGTYDTRSSAAYAILKETRGVIRKESTSVAVPEENVRTVQLAEASDILGISIGEMIGKIQSGDIQTMDNPDGGPRLVIIDDEVA